MYATQHVRPTPVVTLDARRSQRSKQQPTTSSSSPAATQGQQGLSAAAGAKEAADDKASSSPAAAGSRDGAGAAAGPASATSHRADRAAPMPVSSSSSSVGLQPGLIPAVGSPGGPQPSPADLQQAWQGLPEGSVPTPAAAAGALGLPALGLLPDMPGGLPALPHMQVSWVALPLGVLSGGRCSPSSHCRALHAWQCSEAAPACALVLLPAHVAALAWHVAAPHPASMPTSSCAWLLLMPHPATLHPIPPHPLLLPHTTVPPRRSYPARVSPRVKWRPCPRTTACPA